MSRKADKEKIRKILINRGYKDGKPPRGYELHHVKPRKSGGKETPKNIRVIKKTKHREIHANRQLRGLV